MAWGLSFLVREKRALKYFFNRGLFLSALMLAKMAPSTAFWWANLTSWMTFFFLASAKKAAASAILVLLSLVKVLSEIFETSTLLTLTWVLVRMVYTWLTRLSGTPFTLWGPVTRRRPDSNCLRKTTLFPRNLPERRMRTEPGTMPLLSLVALAFFVLRFLCFSSAGYHLNYLTISIKW